VWHRVGFDLRPDLGAGMVIPHDFVPFVRGSYGSALWIGILGAFANVTASLGVPAPCPLGVGEAAGSGPAGFHLAAR